MHSRVDLGGDWQRAGFRGGSLGVARGFSQEMDEGNIASTYSALAALVALEVDLDAEVNGNALVLALRSLQQEDGRCGEVEKLPIKGSVGGGGTLVLRQTGVVPALQLYIHTP